MRRATAGRVKRMNDLLILVKRTYEPDGFTVTKETRREVFCKMASIGQQEFYMAQTSDLRPERKFVIADHLDYEDEALCIYEGTWYHIIRTYRAGQELELVVQRATSEEVGAWAE